MKLLFFSLNVESSGLFKHFFYTYYWILYTVILWSLDLCLVLDQVFLCDQYLPLVVYATWLLLVEDWHMHSVIFEKFYFWHAYFLLNFLVLIMLWSEWYLSNVPIVLIVFTCLLGYFHSFPLQRSKDSERRSKGSSSPIYISVGAV